MSSSASADADANKHMERGRTEETVARSRSRSQSHERDDPENTGSKAEADDNSAVSGRFPVRNWRGAPTEDHHDRHSTNASIHNDIIKTTQRHTSYNVSVAARADTKSECPSSWPPLCASSQMYTQRWWHMFRGRVCESADTVVLTRNCDDHCVTDQKVKSARDSMLASPELSNVPGAVRSPIVLERDGNNDIPYERYFYEAAPRPYSSYYYLLGTYRRIRFTTHVELELSMHRVSVHKGSRDAMTAFVTPVIGGQRSFNVPVCPEDSAPACRI